MTHPPRGYRPRTDSGSVRTGAKQDHQGSERRSRAQPEDVAETTRGNTKEGSDAKEGWRPQDEQGTRAQEIRRGEESEEEGSEAVGSSRGKEEGRGQPGDLELLDGNAEFIGAPGNTFCLHATGAMEPLLSALRYFREDFEAHIESGGCPYRR